MHLDLGQEVTQATFGKVVGISQPAVSDLLRRDVLRENAPLGEWLIDYCGHLREQAAGREASGDLKLATERARLAREQADKVAMQNAVTRGELAPVPIIEEVLTKAASRIAGILDAIPGLVRRRVPALSADEIDLVAAEISKARNRVSSMSLRDLDDDADDNDAAAVEEVAV
jgi:phage terminase Nu1 subunit (DNA packaging protein)